MQYRVLGQTGLKVSEIGFGMEHVGKKPLSTVIQTVQDAVALGINYFDIVYTYPSHLIKIRQAIEHLKDKISLAVHIGVGIENERHKKIRSPERARQAFSEVINHLNISSVAIAMIQNVAPNEYTKIMKPSGLIKLAHELKETQQVKFIGMSTHDIVIAEQALASNEFDVIMTQYSLFADAIPERRDFPQKCFDSNVGFIAMKPFATGWLFKKGNNVRVPRLRAGGEARIISLPEIDHMPARCIAYNLSNHGVSTTIAGFTNSEEVKSALEYYSLPPSERDYKDILKYLAL